MLMKNDIFRQTALLVVVVLLSTGFWSCSKDEKQDPEPSAIAVTGVTLKKTSISIQVDDKETLIATVLPEDATNITVTTEDGDKTATCLVTVEAVPVVAVTGVTLNKTSLKLYTRDSETLTATVAPAGATNKNVIWTSSEPTVATVDANGKVTAKSTGIADITVTTEDGGKTATCRVGVVRRP